MRELSAISVQRSATRVLLLLLVSLTCVLLLGADNDARFNSLGHKMICACGCNQILLECNHVGCPLSDGMRNELAAGIQRGDSDDLILQSFLQKYGPTVLAAPPNVGFNRVAWIMPFLVLFAGFAAAVLIVRSWKSLPPPTPPSLPSSSGFNDEIRRETEL
jgi:cytochrome c-type biogenesis protein CcmH/NrfF